MPEALSLNSEKTTKWAERVEEHCAYLAVQEAVKHRDEEALRGRGGRNVRWEQLGPLDKRK